MDKLNENLPLSFGKDLREELDKNFHILNVLLGSLSQEEVLRYVNDKLKDYDAGIKKQIQAIIDPRYNEVALEIERARTDSQGSVHKTINDRINAEVRRLEVKLNGKSSTSI